jgi:3-deoxy-7-phosphoheptulonate synthase
MTTTESMYTLAANQEPPTTTEVFMEFVPRTVKSAAVVSQYRHMIKNILNEKSDRLLVIFGPGSAQESQPEIQYAGLLKKVAEIFSADLLVMMRTYLEKSRKSLGWPGLAYGLDRHSPSRFEQGFQLTRSLMADITAMAIAAITQWLTSNAAAHLEDLLVWQCIGARTVEGRAHRQMASRPSVPAAMKNSTDGAGQPAVRLVRGQSIADACMSWPVTANVFAELAPAERGRRRVIRLSRRQG